MARPSGRTRLAEPPQLRAIDKSEDAFQLTYFDPPAGLERYILALFDFRYSNSVDGRHTGALGQLYLTVRGSVAVEFDDRTDFVEGDPVLFNAFAVARPYRAEGPFWSLGASLSPFGWAALTNASLKEHGDRVHHASDLLGEDVNRMSDSVKSRLLSGAISNEQACLEVAEWIRPRLSSLPDSHEEIIDRTLAWLGSSLNPPVEDLFDDSRYSRRQVERLVQRYFGFAPRALARKFRAIRAANLLAEPDLTDEGEAEIADAFFDQPHMIREIRWFCGFTPSRLGGTDDPMFLRLTHMQNLDRFRPYRSIGKGGKADGPPL